MSGGDSTGGGFGELLRRHRLACGLTQEELANAAGLSVRAVANMERGRTNRPYRGSVQRLADALALPGPERAQLARAARHIAVGGAVGGGSAGGGTAPARAASGHAAGGAPLSPVVPRQLPAAAPHFAGRAAELRALYGLLDTTAGMGGTLVISAISGTAGVGKTALAVRWAHQAAERFPDGQLYVNLRGYDPGQPMRAADALAGFLRALGVAGQDIPVDADESAARYRSLLAGRRMLVVLDNAGDVEQVRPLLPGTPACVAVVTSRDSLPGLVAREGARRLDLDLLPPADAVGLLRALIGPRVDADPEAAAALAAQCSRLPLALRVAAELAVARPAVSLADLAGELADQQRRLDLLDAGGDPRSAVRTVFSWSCRHLDPGAARAFRLLGLHPGSDLDPYAAAALTGTTLERAGHVLDELARAHLIHAAGPGRYGLHDLLRAYARELAADQDGEDESHQALTCLFDHYLYTAAVAMDALVPAEHHHRPRTPARATPAPSVTDPDAARAWLDAQRANLVAVAAHATENGWPGHTTRLAATVSRYLDIGGHFPEAITIHTHARSAARRTGDRAAEATALASLGAVDFRQGRCPQAAGHFQLALAMYRQTGDRTGEARALGNLGIVDLKQGRCQQATGYLQQALAMYRQIGDRTGEARALGNLGSVDQRQGRYEQATSHLKQSVALCRETGDRAGEVQALGSLSLVELRQGRCQQATGHLKQALALCREIGDWSGEANALTNLGDVDLRQGRCQQATGHYRQALARYREFGDRYGEAMVLNGLGEVLLATGRPGHARAEHTTALSLASQTGNKDEQARAHDGLARSYQATGDIGQARRHWQEALTHYTDLGAPEADEVRAQLSTADNKGAPAAASSPT